MTDNGAFKGTTVHNGPRPFEWTCNLCGESHHGHVHGVFLHGFLRHTREGRFLARVLPWVDA